MYSKKNIHKIINENIFTLFMKGDAKNPMCGFSARALQILKKCSINDDQIKIINVLDNEEIRKNIKEYSNWPTIPQFYIKNEFIGGLDIMNNMYKDGTLLEKINSVKE